MRKQFSQRLFDENDVNARHAVERLRHYFGIDEFRDSKNVYTIDREGFRSGNHVLNVEVEVKHNWGQGTTQFPFRTIHLPQRKEKYFDLDKPTYFVIFSSDLKGAIVFSDRTVKEHAMLKEVPNKFVAEGELFYDVPLPRTAWLKL